MSQTNHIPFTGPNMLRILELERKAMRRLEKLARKAKQGMRRLRSDQGDRKPRKHK